MRAADACSYAYLPPTSVPGVVQTFAQIKVGPGVLRYVWVLDDNPPPGATFDVWDGVIGPPTSPGLPPSLSGTILFDRAIANLGPMELNFFSGLVVVYTNNQPQCSGFVSYR